MTTTTVTPNTVASASTPIDTDLELELLNVHIDSALDDVLDGGVQTYSAVRDLSEQRSKFQAVYNKAPWTRFYGDAYNTFHVDRDCYAAKGATTIEPHLSGRAVEVVRALRGSGSVCKMCTHGKDV